MPLTHSEVDIYLETGQKKTFAGAIEWPGWCRSARDEAGALQALYAYGGRYAQALQRGGVSFHSPAELGDLVVVERLEGTSTTDFGAPDRAPAADARPVDLAELERLQSILSACWAAFDAASTAAAGHELRRGPRGGGRDVPAMTEHVLGAEGAYLAKLAWKLKLDSQVSQAEKLALARRETLAALEAAVKDGLPERGPRGGTYWTPRYFVRRAAWHVLDHAWEIEDRIVEG